MKISTVGIFFAFGAAVVLAPYADPHAGPAAEPAQPVAGQLAQVPQVIKIAQAPSRRALVQQVQNALIRLGYDPGPADGLVGERTTRSVRTFQQRTGLPIDGRMSQPLYRALIAAIEKPSPSTIPVVVTTPTMPPGETMGSTQSRTPNSTTPNAAAAAGATFVNSVWTITDAGGAILTLRLMADGKIAEVESPVYWKWQLRGDEIQINYDNKLGGWVERRGRIVSANELRGDASSSRERKWTWRARRNGTAR